MRACSSPILDRSPCELALLFMSMPRLSQESLSLNVALSSTAESDAEHLSYSFRVSTVELEKPKSQLGDRDVLFIRHCAFGVAMTGKTSTPCFTWQSRRRKDGQAVLDGRDAVDADRRTG